MSIEVLNFEMKSGDTLKLKGKISDDADRTFVCGHGSQTPSCLPKMCVGSPLRFSPKDVDPVEGFAQRNAGFAVNLGSSPDNITLHFNPRFHDGDDGAVVICNSKCDDCWDSEQRHFNFPFCKGEKFKIHITFTGDAFTIKLPDDSRIEFPNRLSLDTINFVSISGDVKFVSLRRS